ncbi:hypothetical protein [uncultured Paracoccus sp.]|uniref:hypothetical protein n=1 Tax=uncultured Paracoccus sp. TaxID=189685 RepID=UPI0026117A48|nr:hypothetical protein [uncultured Paracoccus sp.]
MRLFAALPCLALLATLAACSGDAPASNELQLENDGGGKFSGKAGPEWTGAELKREAATSVCGGAEPATFKLTSKKDVWSFKGKC